MRLLFDQNLSPRLVAQLADLYPDSTHVSFVGLDRAADEKVWTYAHDNAYIIVTKDADFSEFGVVHGFPPKVIWLRLGNCTTRRIEMMLRLQYEAIRALNEDQNIGILTLL